MDERDLVTLVCWLAGLSLMVWRPPGGARRPCVIGAAGSRFRSGSRRYAPSGTSA